MSSSKKKSYRQHDLDYKRRIVQEYLRGDIKSADLAAREGLDRGQIYKWKIQLDNRQRNDRIEAIAEEEGVPLDQARKIRELEEELEATQRKLAQVGATC